MDEIESARVGLSSLSIAPAPVPPVPMCICGKPFLSDCRQLSLPGVFFCELVEFTDDPKENRRRLLAARRIPNDPTKHGIRK